MKKLLFLLFFIPLVSFGQTSSEYFQSGLDKAKNGNHYGAIADYNKAIELNPNAAAYSNRGVSKNKLKDYNGAIRDYTKAIELNPDYTDAYFNRALAKYKNGDKNGSCSDWKKAANLGHTNAAKWVAEDCN